MRSDQDLRILCLEDVAADAELEECALREAGLIFTMRRVASRVSFATHLETFKPDLVIVDCRLPDIDGLSAISLVRERQPQLPIILCTGALDDVSAVQLIKAGANDYVHKDRLPRLPIAVERALKEAAELKARQQAEQALRASKAEIEDLYNRAPCGYHSLDGDGRVIAMNDTELSWLG